MFKESLKLGNFKKVYPMALLSTVFLMLTSFCLHKGNASETEMIFTVGGFFVSVLLFLFFYIAQVKTIGNELTAEFQDEEPMTMKETLKSWFQYALPSVQVLVVFALVYYLVLPLVGTVAGGIFQVEILGVSMNLLTFLLNMIMIVWMTFALVEINTIGVGFKDTFSYTINFVFTNFRKVFLYMIVYLLTGYLLLLMLVFTMDGNQVLLLPVKALIVGYGLAFLNTYAANLFIDNVSDEDFNEDETEAEAE